MTYDLLVRGGRVVAADGHRVADVGVVDGVVVVADGEVDGDAREVVDAAGCLVLPGAVDAHVHLNDPGRADWEGFATGTAAPPPPPPHTPGPVRLGGLCPPPGGRGPRAGRRPRPPARPPPPRRRSTARRSTPRRRWPVGSRGSTSRCGAGWFRATSTASTSSR